MPWNILVLYTVYQNYYYRSAHCLLSVTLSGPFLDMSRCQLPPISLPRAHWAIHYAVSLWTLASSPAPPLRWTSCSGLQSTNAPWRTSPLWPPANWCTSNGQASGITVYTGQSSNITNALSALNTLAPKQSLLSASFCPSYQHRVQSSSVTMYTSTLASRSTWAHPSLESPPVDTLVSQPATVTGHGSTTVACQS